MKIRTFIFLDLETTGLKKPIEITELTLLAIHRNHLVKKSTQNQRGSENLPRVTDKVTLCVKPVQEIENVASSITKLKNDDLKKKIRFDVHVGQIISSFIERQTKPVCLVAHNGERFDFEILSSELTAIGLRLPEHLYVADSLTTLRQMRGQTSTRKENEKILSRSLVQIIKNESLALQNLITLLLRKPHEDPHTAEGDTVNLAKIVCKYNELVFWFDQNAHLFKSSGSNDLRQVKGIHPDEKTKHALQDEYHLVTEE